MKEYIGIDPWKIIESGFHRENSEVSESLFSLGNGFTGHRGNFEEQYSGHTLQGSYFGGIYYPDKTRVGWWKNGYPEYFAKVLNSVNWIGINIQLGEEVLDIHTGELLSFHRELDMQKGILTREFTWVSPNGKKVHCRFERFCSLADREICSVKATITPIDNSLSLTLKPYLNFDVRNKDANYDEQFWTDLREEVSYDGGRVAATTRKTGFHVGTAMMVETEGRQVSPDSTDSSRGYCSLKYSFDCQPGESVTLVKYVCSQSSLYHDEARIYDQVAEKVKIAASRGYNQLREDHISSWASFWHQGDIKIEGDTSAQQAIRYNIFQLWQTYQGQDPRLNIGPKGFTGEKYGGSTYWDTEAYCLPFYLGTCKHEVGKNLLLYRYQHLQKAIENAEKLGFHSGAALYPMVTMNGEECHNEWEITFEEIHRNGAIAYAIHNYIQYTGHREYLLEAGLEVLVGIARFWAQRVNWSIEKEQYVMLGVTGPNEYENNVNNNWYTNLIARWCLRYARESLDWAREHDPAKYSEITAGIALKSGEVESWSDIAGNIYLPEDVDRGIFLQQDQYMDKDQQMADDLDPSQRPIHQHWSWDRILRSCFIKQADVLQGLYFFEDDFDRDTIRRNFNFYEPRTVHESSLSPCIHSILASHLDMPEKAYEMYLRTARLDLEDVNNDTNEGLHITSMAGTWLTIIKGFAGLKVKEGVIHINPALPSHWKSISFHLYFKDIPFRFLIEKNTISITNPSDREVPVLIHNQEYLLQPGSTFTRAENHQHQTLAK